MENKQIKMTDFGEVLHEEVLGEQSFICAL